MINLAKFARAVGHKTRTEDMPCTVIQASDHVYYVGALGYAYALIQRF
jgi:hypothetical protein